jgi:hypothetical protein
MTVHGQIPAAIRKPALSAVEIFAKNKNFTRDSAQPTESKRSQPKTKAIYNPSETHSNPFISHLKPILSHFFGPKSRETNWLGLDCAPQVADNA